MTVGAETQAAGGARGPEPSHPLQRLGADEIRRARTLLAEHGLVGEHTRFARRGITELDLVRPCPLSAGSGPRSSPSTSPSRRARASPSTATR